MVQAGVQSDKAWWVIVADEARAIFYTRETMRAPLVCSFELDNDAGRKKPGELEADRGGRSFDSFGAGRHSMAKDKSGVKKHAAEAFAKDIAERIGKAVHEGRCRGYAIIAAPRFLGTLRAAVTASCSTDPFRTIAKEVVGRDAGTLQELLDGD